MAQPDIGREGKSRRPPGELPNTMRPFEDAMAVIERAPDGLRKTLAPAFQAIVDGARVQTRLNRMLWLRFAGLPARHGSTHRDGDDNIASSDPPTSIGLASVLDPGTPHAMHSRGDHQHTLDSEIVDIIDAIGGIAVDPVDGMAVTDNVLRRLLEQILLGLLDLENALMASLARTRNRIVTARPPYAVPSSATEVTLFPPNAARAGFVIQNLSTQVLSVKFGTAVSSTSLTYSVASNAVLEPQVPYTGIVTGVWVSANGSAYCTELVFEDR